MGKKRHKHCFSWIMARKLKNVEDEKLTGKTNNMARNTEKPSKRETHTISPKKCQEKVKNVNNEKCTLSYLVYGYKNAKCGKCEKYTVGPGIWREK